MPVALTAVNDQRAVCFQSVMIAAASMGLSPPPCLPRCAMDPLFSSVKCFSPCSWCVEKGEAFLAAGSTHGQVHRFFNSESCLLTSLCISVAGLGVWEQA